MKIRAYAFALLVALLPIASIQAPAQAQGAAKDAVTEMARQRFQEGVRLFDAGKFEEARAAFVQAYALKKHPAVLLNLAQSEVKSNHPVDAARHFVLFIRENSSAQPNELRAAEKGLAEARQKTGRLVVTVNMPGADVLVDDEVIGRAPLTDPVDVSGGSRKVEARLAGYPAVTVQATATVGKDTPVSLSFPGATAAGAVAVVPPAAGATTTTPAPSNTGTPESSSAASTPSSAAEPASGRMGFFPWVAKDQVAWATVGVTGVGLLIGVPFSILAAKNASDADNLAGQIKGAAATDDYIGNRRNNPCADPVAVTTKVNYGPACSQLRDKLDARDSHRTMAIVGWSVFGAGAIGTTVAYFLRSDKDSVKSAGNSTVFTPVFSQDLAGLVVGGSF
jgi:hypothetical protein